MIESQTTRVVRATAGDALHVASIGRVAWVEAHGPSAAPNDIKQYVDQKYSDAAILLELQKPSNFYHLIFSGEKLAGFSNLILDASDPQITAQNVAELDRLYLLREFYDQRIGWETLCFNISLAKEHGQSGLWLYVWTGNDRAIAFYSRAGFQIVGSHDFKISDTHSNPNHLMLLKF